MKSLPTFLVILVSIFTFSQDFKIWSSNETLTFADFKSAVPKNETASVNLATTISFQTKTENGKVVDFDVFNRLNRDASWIKVKKKSVLDLQQIQFDMSELYARKIRKEVAELLRRKEGDKDHYVEIVTKYTKELQSKSQREKVMIEDQPHLIKLLQKEIADSLKEYEAYKN